ncbi:phosphoribosyltransferase [Blastococcus xanthinilyticus]|uniref:Adenine phosphoribosyltransferase n=1 Tax=Blastococcus xanthinilyticus TaxID=1564164 RepID=A0A5S5CS16_9ACTN|nr:phosphoribosyltransferase [Blastococcus xanthinilyticus]TYP84573.1 adenine phosphoribosyltransferase [Blastococcus xanthinilyticus]
MTEPGRRAVLDTFRWVEGHADVWRVFADADALRKVVAGLAAPWSDVGVTHVVGIEARGFVVGAPVAVALGAGFVAVRKGPAGALPGATLTTTAAADYRRRRHDLRMQDLLGPGTRVLLVDDWAERGSQATAAATLVRRSGAEFLGVSLVVDELSDDVRTRLGRVTSLVTRQDLGDL